MFRDTKFQSSLITYQDVPGGVIRKEAGKSGVFINAGRARVSMTPSRDGWGFRCDLYPRKEGKK